MYDYNFVPDANVVTDEPVYFNLEPRAFMFNYCESIKMDFCLSDFNVANNKSIDESLGGDFNVRCTEVIPKWYKYLTTKFNGENGGRFIDSRIENGEILEARTLETYISAIADDFNTSICLYVVYGSIGDVISIKSSFDKYTPESNFNTQNHVRSNTVHACLKRDNFNIKEIDYGFSVIYGKQTVYF